MYRHVIEELWRRGKSSKKLFIIVLQTLVTRMWKMSTRSFKKKRYLSNVSHNRLYEYTRWRLLLSVRRVEQLQDSTMLRRSPRISQRLSGYSVSDNPLTTSYSRSTLSSYRTSDTSILNESGQSVPSTFDQDDFSGNQSSVPESLAYVNHDHSYTKGKSPSVISYLSCIPNRHWPPQQRYLKCVYIILFYRNWENFVVKKISCLLKSTSNS